ncbi:MAG: sulfurtransferase TusA family protein [Hyphomicrobium sp.]|nr:sulfurtransferase TusA family protein [Hyphomicrobium sp.]
MPDRTLDTRGLACPLPVLKARKAIGELPPGAVLEVLSTDPAALLDFEAFCQATGHELVSQETRAGVIRVEIRRAG